MSLPTNRPMQFRTHFNSDEHAHRDLLAVFVGVLFIVSAIITATMNEPRAVVVVVSGVIGAAGLVMTAFGAFDSYKSWVYRRRAIKAHLCPSKEVYYENLKREPTHARAVFGSAFVDALPHMGSGG
jgi:hypothetical protein